MGVSKKGRRSIKYKEETFVWWVGKDNESEDDVYLNIVSEDKRLVLAYRVGEGDFFIISKGRFFQGEKTSGCWERYWYPMKEPPMTVAQRFVYELISWAVDGRDAAKVIIRKKAGES